MADGALSGLIASVLKVPAEPDPPAGSPGSVRVFNAAPGYYHYRLATWALRQLGTAIGLIVGLIWVAEFDFAAVPFGVGVYRIVEGFAVAGYVLQLPVTFLLVRLDYRYRWYMTTDTSLRIREGITTVRERTMTYANIQNLSLKQGPIQRLFGISDLQVRTAGGGGADDSEHGKGGHGDADNMHLGYFRGVDNADEIRNLILSEMKGMRDSGLGDPDEADQLTQTDARDDDLAAAARELLSEARALRAAMAG